MNRDISKAPYELKEIGIKGQDTITNTPPISLEKITVRDIRKDTSSIAKKWKIPRTLDKEGIYSDALDNNSNKKNTKKEIKEVFDSINHPLLLGSLNENAYRVVHSGYWIGTNKCNTRRGDSSVCQICKEEETVKHMYCECNKIQAFWKKLFKW